MKKILINYPFIDPAVEIIEGYSAYDGYLKDPIGAPHKGIDYVLRCGRKFVSFCVYSMHDGNAFQGASPTWGKFVIVYDAITRGEYRTIYAHLRSITRGIPVLPESGATKKLGKYLPAGSLLGQAGLTGRTNRLIQLHIELHHKRRNVDQPEKLDPYGVYDRFSSGRYPQPGQSLVKLSHAWKSHQANRRLPDQK